MSFWYYLGLACLIEAVFGKKKQACDDYYYQRHDDLCVPDYDPEREAELDEKYFSLSKRIDDLEDRLNRLNPDSDLYDELDDEIETMRDELDDLEDRRGECDDF